MERDGTPSPLTPELLLRVYAAGVFPMAEDADDPTLHWVDPDERGVLPLDGFHVSRSLQRRLRRNPFDMRVDSAFDAVVAACAQARLDRPTTWINAEIRRLVSELHRMGHAHSVESWHDGQLVGGLYGIALKGAFFGESMFSRATDASKLALCHLVARLRHGGFVLLDTQFLTDHLAHFGTIEISREDYHARLSAALGVTAEFYRGDLGAGELEFRQDLTQTS